MNTEIRATTILLLLVVYFFVGAAPIWAKPDSNCQHLLGLSKDSEEFMDQLIRLEQQLEETQNIVYAKHSSNSSLQAKLGALQAHYQQLTANWDDPAIDTHQFLRELNHMLTLMTKFSEELALIEKQNSTTSFEKAIEEPTVLVPNKTYILASMDPDVTGVSFSQEVLQSIFWSTQPIMLRAQDLIYRGLIRGRRHATDKSGIILFVNEHDVYKVKIAGTSVGAIRVAGFFQGKVFHIVAWAQESSHNGHNSNRLTEHVKNIRLKFEKTGSY